MACVVAGICVAGCPRPRIGRPAWLVSGVHEIFPPADFLVGVGGGASAVQAGRNAVADLSGKLTSIYAELLQEHETARRKSGAKFNPYTPGDEEFEALPVPSIGMRWSSSDGNHHAAMAVIDRHQAAATILEQIEQSAKSLATMASEAELAASGRDRAKALRMDLGALVARFTLLRQQVIYQAVSGAEAPASGGPGADELLQRIRTVLDAVHIEVIRGNGQRVTEDGSLTAPLVAGAYYVAGQERFPIKGLPLVFLPPDPAPGVHAISSDVGTCAVEVTGLPASGSARNVVGVGLDRVRLLEGAGAAIDAAGLEFLGEWLSAPRAEFAYLSRDQAVVRVMLLIEELRFGQLLPESQAAKSISRQLVQAGFNVIDPSVAGEALAAIESLDEAPALVAPYVDVLVYGRLGSNVSQLINENFMFCMAGGKLRAVEPSSGKQLSTFDDTCKSAGQDRYSACQRASDRLVKKVLERLVRDISKTSGEEE